MHHPDQLCGSKTQKPIPRSNVLYYILVNVFFLYLCVYFILHFGIIFYNNKKKSLYLHSDGDITNADLKQFITPKIHWIQGRSKVISFISSFGFFLLHHCSISPPSKEQLISCSALFQQKPLCISQFSLFSYLYFL